jgi:hypothetical protein
MRPFTLRMTTVSRTRGQSSVAAAAYQRGAKLWDERATKWHNPRRDDEDVVSARLYLPPDAPHWASDPAQLWNRNEIHNRRRDALVARAILLAIPHELCLEEAIDLVREFAQHLAQTYRIAVDACIHSAPEGGDHRNLHAHILMTTSSLTSSGFGKKVPELDPIAMRYLGNTRSEGPSAVRPLNAARQLRPYWQELINRRLIALGVTDFVDHRSYREQRHEALAQGDWRRAYALNRTPGKHLGPARVACLRKGLVQQGRASTRPTRHEARRRTQASNTTLSSTRESGATQLTDFGAVRPGRVTADDPGGLRPPLGGRVEVSSARVRTETRAARTPLSSDRRADEPTAAGSAARREDTIRRPRLGHDGDPLNADDPRFSAGPAFATPRAAVGSIRGHRTRPVRVPVTPLTTPSLTSPTIEPPPGPVTHFISDVPPQILCAVIEPLENGNPVIGTLKAASPGDGPTSRITDPVSGHRYTCLVASQELEIRDYGHALVILSDQPAHLTTAPLDLILRQKGWKAVGLKGSRSLCDATRNLLSRTHSFLAAPLGVESLPHLAEVGDREPSIARVVSLK